MHYIFFILRNPSPVSSHLYPTAILALGGSTINSQKLIPNTFPESLLPLAGRVYLNNTYVVESVRVTIVSPLRVRIRVGFLRENIPSLISYIPPSEIITVVLSCSQMKFSMSVFII